MLYFTSKTEDELFSNIAAFSSLQIALNHSLVALMNLRNRLVAMESNNLVKLKDYTELWRGFEHVVECLKGMRRLRGHSPSILRG